MKKIIISFILLLICSCESSESENNIAIVIHGGAGTILKENMTPELEAAYIGKLEEAVMTGYEILKTGGSSQSAVKETIKIMEDSPLFNAGIGAALTNEETASLDASFMEGKNLNAGAIAGSKYIKNPINAAISVMEDSPHVLLSSDGADEFAIKMGLDTVPNSYFITERRLNSVRKAKKDDMVSFEDSYINDSKYGTVGCVAIDINGNFAKFTQPTQYDYLNTNFIFEKRPSVAVAVSGGPDSLALAFLTKIYSIKYKLNSRYFIVDHKLRRESTYEAHKVKRVLKSLKINSQVLTWREKNL